MYDEKHYCECCLYYNEIDENHGECRKHAPIIFKTADLDAVFPQVTPDSWCGDNPCYAYPESVFFK